MIQSLLAFERIRTSYTAVKVPWAKMYNTRRSSLLNLLGICLACIAATVTAQGENVLIFETTPSPPPTAAPAFVLVNNRPVLGTMTPFITQPPPSANFLACFGSCPTTSEYNPICGSNMQLYLNEQKFNCARRCGADIQIVRRGSCEGLFQMQRG